MAALAPGRRRRGARAPLAALAAGLAALLCAPPPAAGFALARGGRPARRCPRGRAARRASSADTFDPWTALGIAPNAGDKEARQAYKAIIRKFHPDIDPSPEARKKFQDAVRAQAVISGEDRMLDESTLLKNAVENLRSDVEFKKQQIDKLKAQAADEERSVMEMEQQMKLAKKKRDEINFELGLAGGATLGAIVGLAVGFIGVPAGLALGSLAGVVVKDNEDGVGSMVRAVGQLTKGVVGQVSKEEEVTKK